MAAEWCSVVTGQRREEWYEKEHACLLGPEPKPVEQAEKWTNAWSAKLTVTGTAAAMERWTHVEVVAVTAQVMADRLLEEAAPHEQESCLPIDFEALRYHPHSSCRSRHPQVGRQPY